MIFPFLPGDSLLFVAGTFYSSRIITFFATFLILFVAAVVGDSVNYWIGNIFGKKIVDNPKITFINQEHIDKTEAFYKKYGGKQSFWQDLFQLFELLRLLLLEWAKWIIKSSLLTMFWEDLHGLEYL